jgi:hypothetical protein
MKKRHCTRKRCERREVKNVYRRESEIKGRWRENIRSCVKLVKRGDVKKRLIVIKGEQGMLSKEDTAYDKETMCKEEECSSREGKIEKR